MNLILIILVIVLLVGALPTWPYSQNWGPYPAGGLLVAVVVILLIFMLLGHRL